MTTKVTASFSLTQDLIDQVEESAWQNRKSRSAMVRQLLTNGLAAQGGTALHVVHYVTQPETGEEVHLLGVFANANMARRAIEAHAATAETQPEYLGDVVTLGASIPVQVA